MKKHWAEDLEQGDFVLGTIIDLEKPRLTRHKVEVMVVKNLRQFSKIVAIEIDAEIQITYDNLTQNGN